MTRINCIPVEELTREHLLGEWKELRRIFTFAARWDANGRPTSIPSSYRMGTGHVTFFYDKLNYCWKRHFELAEEMKRCGYNVQGTAVSESYKSCPRDLFNDWQPDEAAMAINRARIDERLTKEGA